MTDLPPTIKAMLADQYAPTAPIYDYVKAHKTIPNLWWLIESGHHLNLFDELLESTEEMLYTAWTIIANASNWEHDKQWTQAAEKWRDQWHATFTVS